jgi:endonuclease YncB( thermonuclease family)
MTANPRPEHRWLYPCRVLRVVDADTVVVLLDRGWHDYAERTVRLVGVNAPELHAADPAPGQAARQWVQGWVGPLPQPEGSYGLLLESNKLEKYGRTLGTLWRGDGRCLNQDLLESGHAVVMK